MEDVLELYEQPYDAKRPVVCFDENPVQLVAETRLPRPVLPGRPRRYDYEYERRGTANIFMAVEPLVGRRHVMGAERRTKLVWCFRIGLTALEAGGRGAAPCRGEGGGAPHSLNKIG